jgi:raffinose/stachyose/melibiose transport system permease protein
MTQAARRTPAANRGYWWYLLPGGVLFVAIVAVPFAMNIGISLTKWDGVGSPLWTGLGNYHRLFADAMFWASFRHSLALIVAMAIVPTVLGLLLAYALFDVVARRIGVRAASALRACFYLPQVLPIAVAGVLVWVQIGFPLVVFMSGLQRVDPALYEAAELDGASWGHRLWHVTIPQIRPEIGVVLLWTTIAALKVFPPIYVLTKGGPGDATNVPSYFSFQNFFDKTDVGYGASIATVLTLLILAMAAVFLRFQGRDEEG